MGTFLPLSVMVAGLLLGGCYTQLYTQGQFARAESDPYSRYSNAGAEERAAGSTQPTGDTLREPPGTVIVNNYYRERPDYRGYSISDWDHPSLRFGFYHAGYRDYYGPYWWNDPWYHRQRSYRHDYDRLASGPRKGRRAPDPAAYSPLATKAAQNDPVYVAP